MNRNFQIRLLLALVTFVVLVQSVPALASTPTTTPYTCLCADGTPSPNCGHQGACSYHGGYASTATPTPYYPPTPIRTSPPAPIRTWTPTPIHTSTPTPTRTPPWWLASPTALPSPTQTPFRAPTLTPVPPSFRPTPAPTPLAGCPDERENVKDGTDPDVGLINLTSTVRTTIEGMRSWPEPSILPPHNRISPYETTLWTVSATLVQYKREADSDYHLILLDQFGNTLIAEIPSPDCLPDTAPLLPEIRNARAQFDANYQAERVFKTANIPVQVTGVGMFDFMHGQTGVAPNGIELHPVLNIQFDQAASGPDFAISASEEVAAPDQDSHAHFSVLVDGRSGFGSAVSLSLRGLPAGVTTSLPGPVQLGVMTPIDVRVDSSVLPGGYSFVVTAESPEARRYVVLNLVVPSQRMPVVIPLRTPLQRPIVVRH
jgi:hypothetical protein